MLSFYCLRLPALALASLCFLLHTGLAVVSAGEPGLAPGKAKAKSKKEAKAEPNAAFKEAQADFKARADARKAAIDKLRPSPSEVQAAKETLASLSANERRVLSALRFLAPQRSADLPRFEKDLVMPPLGTLKADKDEVADSWVYLRLLALARSGFPCCDSILAEMEVLLGCATPYVTQTAGWSDVALELLTLAALCDWSDAPRLKDSLSARARLVCAQISFDVKTPQVTDARSVYFLFNAMLARHLARTRGWKDGLTPDGWKGPLNEMVRFAKTLDPRDKNLWGGKDPECNPAERNRVCLLLGSFLALAGEEAALKGQTISTLLAGAQARIAQNASEKNAWRVYFGDSLPLLLCPKDMGAKTSRTQVEGELVKYALGESRNPDACPRPENSHVAAALGWVLMPAQSGMGRDALTLESRDFAASLCLALCGAHGGLFAGKAIIDESKALARMRALETLEVAHHLDRMEKTDTTVDTAALYLCSMQGADGSFTRCQTDGKDAQHSHCSQYCWGSNAYAALAILDADANPDLTIVKRAMDWLRKNPPLMQYMRGEDSWHNYCVGIYLMAFQKFYEPAQRKAGMFDAKTPLQFAAAREKAWRGVCAADRDLLGNMSWSLSQTCGYGWSYYFPQVKPPVTTSNSGKPITGEGKQESEDGRKPAEFPARPSTADSKYRGSDSSNTQYSVLGLKAALMLGAPLNFTALAWEGERLIDSFVVTGNAERVVGELAIRKVLTTGKSNGKDDSAERRSRAKLQCYDIGGWNYYTGKGGSTWGYTEKEPKKYDEDGELVSGRQVFGGRGESMTAAGISSVAIVRDAMLMAGSADKAFLDRLEMCTDGAIFFLGASSVFREGSLRAWDQGYTMYSVERAGVLSGAKYFSTVDWYYNGSDALLDDRSVFRARITGALEDDPEDNSLPAKENAIVRMNETLDVSWCILFLKRAAPPMLKEPAKKKTGSPVITGERREKPAEEQK